MQDEKFKSRYRVRRHLPLYRAGRVLVVPALKAISFYEVEGRERIPRRGAVILAATHRSYLDIPFLGVTTWRIVHFMGKAELWERRFSGWFCSNMGAFPVRRDLGDRASLRTAQRVLEDGRVLGIFPEGARKDGPALEDFHGGCIYLAQKTRAPIVPVAMHGTGNLMDSAGKIHPFNKVRIKVGDPVVVPPDAGYRARILALEELRSVMQAMYTQLRQIAGEPTI